MQKKYHKKRKIPTAHPLKISEIMRWMMLIFRKIVAETDENPSWSFKKQKSIMTIAATREQP